MDLITSSTAERWKSCDSQIQNLVQTVREYRRVFVATSYLYASYVIQYLQQMLCMWSIRSTFSSFNHKITSVINMDYSRAFWNYQLHHRWVKIQGFRDVLSFHHEDQCDKQLVVSDLYSVNISLSFSQLNTYHNLHVSVTQVKHGTIIALWFTTSYQ